MISEKSMFNKTESEDERYKNMLRKRKEIEIKGREEIINQFDSLNMLIDKKIVRYFLKGFVCGVVVCGLFVAIY